MYKQYKLWSKKHQLALIELLDIYVKRDYKRASRPCPLCRSIEIHGKLDCRKCSYNYYINLKDKKKMYEYVKYRITANSITEICAYVFMEEANNEPFALNRARETLSEPWLKFRIPNLRMLIKEWEITNKS